MQSTKPKKLKIVFFGNERLATGVSTTAPTLRALISAGYKIEAVIANHVDSVSRQKRDLEIGVVAHAHGIPVILPGSKIALAEKLQKHPADIGVLAAFGQIVPQAVIDMFPHGIVNIHPSLLPAYRGTTPIETAMLNGDTKTGVSIMSLVKEMDAGPIFAQQAIALQGTETKQQLSDQLGKLGAHLLIQNLPQITDGTLAPTPQQGTPTFTKMIQKSDGFLDASKSAPELECQVRAFADWPKSYVEQDGQRFIITKAQASNHQAPSGSLCASDKKLYFGCKNGSLEILEIQPAGKAKMHADAFINGYTGLLS